MKSSLEMAKLDIEHWTKEILIEMEREGESKSERTIDGCRDNKYYVLKFLFRRSSEKFARESVIT